VIQEHYGSIDKYIGDGILASFGAVVASATYAADLCRAIEDLARTAQSWREERQRRGLSAPAVGIAGAVGEAVFGMIGHETKLEYTVVGEVVNLVAKLEKHTKVEGAPALITRDACGLAIAQGYRPRGPTEDRPRRPVEGLADPVDLVAFGY